VSRLRLDRKGGGTGEGGDLGSIMMPANFGDNGGGTDRRGGGGRDGEGKGTG